ncbi:hypothetical protein LTR33_018800, partial [Friedmanniomyces endolithicus]
MPQATSPSPEQDAPANVEDSYMTDAPPAPAEDAESTGDTTDSQPLPTNGAPSTLESMFDDDDDDGDEFSSSGPTKADESSQDKPQQQQTSKP